VAVAFEADVHVRPFELLPAYSVYVGVEADREGRVAEVAQLVPPIVEALVGVAYDVGAPHDRCILSELAADNGPVRELGVRSQLASVDSDQSYLWTIAPRSEWH
jgi:hypothetical protein